ncbi:MAG: hypothetical protein N2Z76_03805 [Treponemataceae bacterium]|nr:hypothetical protein [Treponemataceae bacterium]
MQGKGVQRKGHLPWIFKKVGRGILFSLLLALLLLFIGAAVVFWYQKQVIHSLETKIAEIQVTTIPLRFMLMSRSDMEIAARFRFYTPQGKEIASFERSWRGRELVIDSLVVPVGKHHFVFPFRVFTDQIAPRSGTLLFQYYDYEGFPGIFESPTLSAETRRLLSVLFQRLKVSEGLLGTSRDGEVSQRFSKIFGNAVHDIRQLRPFEVGVVYALVVHPDGGIEIVQE